MSTNYIINFKTEFNESSPAQYKNYYLNKKYYLYIILVSPLTTWIITLSFYLWKQWFVISTNTQQWHFNDCFIFLTILKFWRKFYLKSDEGIKLPNIYLFITKKILLIIFNNIIMKVWSLNPPLSPISWKISCSFCALNFLHVKYFNLLHHWEGNIKLYRLIHVYVHPSTSYLTCTYREQ